MSDNQDLLKIKDTIEKQTKEHQIEILRILVNNKIPVNENSNGVFINLTTVDKKIVDLLQNYLNYVCEQEASLNKLENEKIEYKKTFFCNSKNEIKDSEYNNTEVANA